MPRPNENLVKKSVRIHEEDWELLQLVYGELGTQKAFRTIIRQHCTFLRRNMKTGTPTPPSAEEVDLNELERTIRQGPAEDQG